MSGKAVWAKITTGRCVQDSKPVHSKISVCEWRRQVIAIPNSPIQRERHIYCSRFPLKLVKTVCIRDVNVFWIVKIKGGHFFAGENWGPRLLHKRKMDIWFFLFNDTTVTNVHDVICLILHALYPRYVQHILLHPNYYACLSCVWLFRCRGKHWLVWFIILVSVPCAPSAQILNTHRGCVKLQCKTDYRCIHITVTRWDNLFFKNVTHYSCCIVRQIFQQN